LVRDNHVSPSHAVVPAFEGLKRRAVIAQHSFALTLDHGVEQITFIAEVVIEL
jgi:hypothetical protein